MEIKEFEEQSILGMRATTSHDGIGAKLGEILPAVWGYAVQNGVQPAGPPLCIYHTWTDTDTELEGAIPVAGGTSGSDTITASTLPAGRAAVEWHVGPYDTLSQTHQALMKYIEEQGLTMAGSPWEVYWTDPGEEPDSAKWRTEVIYPIR